MQCIREFWASSSIGLINDRFQESNLWPCDPVQRSNQMCYRQGRSEGGYWGGGGVVNPPNFFKINIFGKSGWPLGKLRQ